VRFVDVECSYPVADKLASKHGVQVYEVEEGLAGDALVKRAAGGLYHVWGRSEAGRYLAVVVRDLGVGRARLVTARDMTARERRRYRER
jgi:uncharacterized DUF497 family protein